MSSLPVGEDKWDGGGEEDGDGKGLVCEDGGKSERPVYAKILL